jgi:hypothetical protein
MNVVLLIHHFLIASLIFGKAGKKCFEKRNKKNKNKETD